MTFEALAGPTGEGLQDIIPEYERCFTRRSHRSGGTDLGANFALPQCAEPSIHVEFRSNNQGQMAMILIEVEPNPSGPWDPDSEVELGSFDTREEAVAFARQTLLDEGWDPEEIDLMPRPGDLGSRFQFVF